MANVLAAATRMVNVLESEETIKIYNSSSLDSKDHEIIGELVNIIEWLTLSYF